jgi:hypothetical protein
MVSRPAEPNYGQGSPQTEATSDTQILSQPVLQQYGSTAQIWTMHASPAHDPLNSGPASHRPASQDVAHHPGMASSSASREPLWLPADSS